MADLEKIKEKLIKIDSTVKTIQLIERISLIGIGIVDKATNGKATKILEDVQDKIDNSFGPNLEAKFTQLEDLINEKFGSKVDGSMDKIDKIIDAKGGKKIEKAIQKTAETIQAVYDGSAIKKTVDQVIVKATEAGQKTVETIKTKVNEAKEKKSQKKKSTKPKTEPKSEHPSEFKQE